MALEKVYKEIQELICDLKTAETRKTTKEQLLEETTAHLHRSAELLVAAGRRCRELEIENNNLRDSEGEARILQTRVAALLDACREILDERAADAARLEEANEKIEQLGALLQRYGSFSNVMRHK